MSADIKKAAVVTGGNAGLGRATAIELAKKGMNVAICGRRTGLGMETLEILKKYNEASFFSQVDISSSIEVEKFIRETVERFGRLDYAVNNASIGGVLSFAADYPEDEFDKVIGINLKGTWLCMKYELKEMLKNRSGSIVNISSVSGLVGVKFGGAPYSASKHGVLGLTKSAALEYADKGIRINAICPGGIDTEMLDQMHAKSENIEESKKSQIQSYPMKRIASSEEVARTVVWLCGDDSSFMTGTAIPVDGGKTAY